MKWTIAYANQLGALEQVQIDADTREEALSISRIPASKLVKVTHESKFASLMDPAPSMPVQIAFLASLSSAVGAGKAVDTEVINLVESNKAFARKLPAVKAKTLCSQRFRILKFHQIAIMLAEVGERSGTIAGSISMAAKMLSGNYRLEKEMKKGIKPQVIVMCAVVLMLCAMPYLFDGIFKEMMAPGAGISINITLTTELLFAIKKFLDSAWFVPIIVIGLIITFRGPIWRKVRSWPLLRQVNELNKTRRAVRFISTYSTLDFAGVPAAELLSKLRDSSSGEDRHAYSNLYDQVDKGKALSESFQAEFFPDLMIRCLYGMESLDRQSRRESLDMLQGNLMTSVEILAETVVSRFKLMAFVTLAIVLGIILTGVYYPLITLS